MEVQEGAAGLASFVRGPGDCTYPTLLPSLYHPTINPSELLLISIGKTSDLESVRSHPPFSSLLLNSNGPLGNAWGRIGADDQLGTLNFLTPPVAAAAKEIVLGVRMSLNWPLNEPRYTCYGRYSTL